MEYNPALDGVRAVAMLVVVAFHCGVPVALGGMIGVDLFFVLSGFLITTLLRNELAATGTILLPAFYWRRMLRLWPPLLIFLVSYYYVAPHLFPDIDVVSQISVAGLYLTDYSMAIWRTPLELGHTWSLAVEEHFYLLWPLIILATKRVSNRTLFRFLLVSFCLATFWRITDGVAWEDFFWTYYRFDTRMSGLFLGSALAVMRWRPDEGQANLMGRMSLYILILAVILLRSKTMWSLEWGGVVADLASAGLILSLVSGHSTPLFRVFSHPMLVYLGVVSYSTYLWHYPIARALRDTMNPFLAFLSVAVIAILMATVSHVLIERPLKNVRRNHSVAA